MFRKTSARFTSVLAGRVASSSRPLSAAVSKKELIGEAAQERGERKLVECATPCPNKVIPRISISIRHNIVFYLFSRLEGKRKAPRSKVNGGWSAGCDELQRISRRDITSESVPFGGKRGKSKEKGNILPRSVLVGVRLAGRGSFLGAVLLDVGKTLEEP